MTEVNVKKVKTFLMRENDVILIRKLAEKEQRQMGGVIGLAVRDYAKKTGVTLEHANS